MFNQIVMLASIVKQDLISDLPCTRLIHLKTLETFVHKVLIVLVVPLLLRLALLDTIVQMSS